MSIKIIEVFSVGTHTDSAGNSKEWTEEEVKGIVTKYNEMVTNDKSSIVPIVKGHPETDAPAYGWVQELEYDDGVMKAHVKFNKLFEEEIKDEQYKKVSIALFEDNTLRHIGMLGAVPPAVKGLENVEFSFSKMHFAGWNFEEEKVEDVIEKKDVIIDTKDNKKEFAEIQLKENLKRDKPEIYSDYNSSDFADPTHFKFPIKTKGQVLSSIAVVHKGNTLTEYTQTEIDIIKSRIIQASSNIGINLNPETWTVEFAEVKIDTKDLSKNQLEKIINNTLNNNKEFNMNEWLEKLKSAIISLVVANSSEEAGAEVQAGMEKFLTENPMPKEEAKTDPAFTQALKEIETLKYNARTKEHNEFADGLIAKGVITPAEKPNIVNTMELLHSNDKKMEFSSGDNKSQVTALEAYKLTFSGMKGNDLTKDVALDGKGEEPTEFRVNLDKKAKEFQAEQLKAGKEVAYDVAVRNILSTGV